MIANEKLQFIAQTALSATVYFAMISAVSLMLTI